MHPTAKVRVRMESIITWSRITTVFGHRTAQVVDDQTPVVLGACFSEGRDLIEGMLVCTQLLFGLLSASLSDPPMDFGLLSLLFPLPVRPPRLPFAMYSAEDVCCCNAGAKPETAAAHMRRTREESFMFRCLIFVTVRRELYYLCVGGTMLLCSTMLENAE